MAGLQVAVTSPTGEIGEAFVRALERSLDVERVVGLRRPVLMDTAKARRPLKWRPRHDARQTLHEMVAAARDDLSG